MTSTRYIFGFLLSLAITCASFGGIVLHRSTNHHFPTHHELFYWILVLAVVQLIVQMVYFLHLGRESKSRDILSLTLAASLILFIVIGSLWIMANLSQNHELPYNGDITPQTSTD